MLPILATALLSPVFLPSQTDAAVRKTGTIYKKEVDGLIGVLRDTARRGVGSPADKAVLGTDVMGTAKILVAMGHCHRRYHISDGPVVRPSLNYLLASRQADGSFGDAAATAWVVDAFELMNADGYREEVAVARNWLAKNGSKVATFDAMIATVIENVRADRFPQDMAAPASKLAKGWMHASDSLDRTAATESLLALVACQAANRKLDKAQGQDGGATVWTASQQKAFDWLLTQQKDGVFMVTMPVKNPDPQAGGGQVMRQFPDPALTGFGQMALQGKPMAKRTAAEQKVIDQGLAWLLTQQNEDGTFGDRVPNYTTCVIVGALTRKNDPSFAPVLQKAQKAILMFQNSEAGGYESGDRDYGSIGYGSSQRGDLSNLHFSIEALRRTGLPEDHEALQKALVFLQRTQNLKSVNDFKGKVPDPKEDGKMLDVTPGDDGGAVYYPGNSAAGYVVQPNGKTVPRSYGSMTYALLKSYTLAGVKGDDPRVKAAVKWIQNNWTLAVNPGHDPALGEKVKYQGLFYYYMVLAQALDAVDLKTVKVPRETEGKDPGFEDVDWRKALRDHLTGMQRADGTWINAENDRWMEGLPLLCTCYAMIALEHAR